MVGLIRGVSEGLGPVGGAAAIYSLSGLLLIFTVGFPRIRQIPKGYLLAGSLLFVSYEICLALSLGYAATRHQAIEVGMVNYLWPSLTILFAILFNGQKTNWLIVPGLLLALVGVCWVLGGENGLHYDEIINNITTSPLSYFLAFIGAFIWAAYCTVTNKYARGFNGITVFVLLTGACLWIYYFLTPQPEMVFSTPVMIKLISGCGKRDKTASMTRQKATLIGLIAIVLWSTMVGLIRGVSEGLGPVGGAAAIYSLSGLLLIFTVGFPRIRQIPKGYLLAGSLLFVSYEICLALSLGYAATRHQAIEVGMVNYLWPSLTILFAILFNGQKTNWLIVPGLLLALVGVCWVLGGENGLHYDEIINNITTSPLSYFLAFIGAFIWAAYCTVTNKYARGFNGITVFVLLTGACLWIYYFLTPQPEMVFSTPVMIKLISAAFTLGFAYAAWNVGILHGNVTIMAVGSYFTPVLSSALAAVLLSAPLSFSFWQGALMVCGGSLLCWLATRRG